MRIWLGVGLAIVVGIGAGLAIALVRMSYNPWTGNVGGDASPVRINAPPAKIAPEGVPKVVVENDTYDFGAMDSNSTNRHDFVVRNEGTGLLKLTKGETTCKCTLASFDEGDVPPGGSTKVAMEWTAQSLTGGFRQTATILTNDPDRPRITLTITGRVTAIARAVPSELVFSRISSGEPTRGAVRLYRYASEEPMEITGHDLEATPNAKSFAVAWRPLTADQLKDELDAKSGYEAQITVKPGLPVGTFRQKVSFRTNLKDAATIDVPVRGDVVSDISVTGAEFDPELGVLMLGTVSSRQGAERTVRIFVRGPFCKEVKFEPKEVIPSLLRVKIGKTTEMRSGTVSLTPLIIEIPKGSPPSNHLGSDQGKLGRVTLKTHHPQSPELRIYVRFAVEG